jgi:hypothetical protein
MPDESPIEADTGRSPLLVSPRNTYNVVEDSMTSEKSQYDEFAVDYHWLYSDHVSSGKPALQGNDDVLRDAGPKARILDCSCGIGTFAVALAKLGYEVSGSDGSPGMIEQASLAARNANVDVPLKCCICRFTSPVPLTWSSVWATQSGTLETGKKCFARCREYGPS